MPSTFASKTAHLLGALLISLATHHALAQAYTPGRVARLNLMEGTVHLAPAGSGDWRPAEFNRPLAHGDRLQTAPGARAELHSGSTALRINGPATLEISEQDDTTTRLSLTQGSLALRVRQLYPGETLEVNTPNLAFTATQPGEYRLDVDPRYGTTRITVRSGSAVVYGENGASRTLDSPQQVHFFDRLLGQEVVRPNLQRDAFDLWSYARDRAEDASPSNYWGALPSPAYPQPQPYYVPYPIVVPFPVENPHRFGQDHRRPPPPDWNRPPRPEMRMHDAMRNQAELEQRAQMQRQQQIDREHQQQQHNREQMQQSNLREQIQRQRDAAQQQMQQQQQMRDQQNRQQQQDRQRTEQARPMPRPQMVEPQPGPPSAPDPRRRLLMPGPRPGDDPLK
jgi:hypothetical protein